MRTKTAVVLSIIGSIVTLVATLKYSKSRKKYGKVDLYR